MDDTDLDDDDSDTNTIVDDDRTECDILIDDLDDIADLPGDPSQYVVIFCLLSQNTGCSNKMFIGP